MSPIPLQFVLKEFLKRKYVCRADLRQRAMGLLYVEAEVTDLSKEVLTFLRPHMKDTINTLNNCPKVGTRWLHVKTKGEYELVGWCQIERDNSPGVVYRSVTTGECWVRPREEFYDGRFIRTN